MDLGIWLCVGKVLGTPRHPSVHGYLPPCALVFDPSSESWIITRHKCPDVVGLTSIGDACIRRSRFCYPLFPFKYLVSFKFLVKQWQGILRTLTLFTRTKLNQVWQSRHHLPLGCKGKAAHRMTAWINLIIFGLFPPLVRSPNAYGFPIHVRTCQEFS